MGWGWGEGDSGGEGGLWKLRIGKHENSLFHHTTQHKPMISEWYSAAPRPLSHSGPLSTLWLDKTVDGQQ